MQNQMAERDRPASASSLSKVEMGDACAIASAWLSENRNWIEAGGEGDLSRLVSALATRLRQRS